MKMLKWAVATASLLLLAACGGGGEGAGAPVFGSGDSTGTPAKPTASDLVVVMSSAQMPNTASGSVTATVTALDSNRNTLAGVPVQITADSDAIVGGAAPSTDDKGQVQGTVSIGANRANRIITV